MPEDRISQIRERYRETQKAGTPNIETPDIKTPDIKTPVTQDTNRISLIRERYQQMGMDSRPDNDQGSRPDNDQGWITNLSTGVEAGYDQMRGGLKYFGGEVVDWFDGEQPGTGDRWKKEAASILENAPQGDSFWYDFGSFLPQTVGSLAAVLATPFTGGTSLAAIPAIIGTANIATIAGMSVGSSLHEYDQYTEEMGLETSEMVRLGTGLLNGAIEYAAEKIRLGRFLPKGGLVKKMTAKMVAKNPSLSKNILHKFAQQSPTGYRKYIKAGAYMLNQGKEEGLEELFTETAQSFVNMAYKGEDAWDDFGERAWKSFRGGAMMGIGIGTAGVWATNKTNTTRRKKHGVTLAEYVREKESMMDFVKAPDGSRPLESGVVEIAGTTKNGNYIGITPKGKQIELLPDQISKSITMSNDDFEAYNNALGENHAKAKEILDDVYVKDMTARIDGTVDEMEYFGGQDNAGNGKYFAASDEKGQAIGFVISGGLDTQTDGLSYLIVSDGQGGVKKDQIKSSKIHTIEEISRESIVNYLMTNAGIEKQNMDAQQKAQGAVEDEEVLTNDRVKTKHGNGVVTKMSEVGAVVQLDNGEEKIIPVEELEILRDGIDAEEESVIMKQGRPTDKGVEATSDRKINNEPSQTVQISAKKSVNIYPNEDGTQTIGEGYKDIDEAKAVVNALKKARPNLDKNGFEIINLNQGGDEWAAPEYVIRYSPKTLKDVQVKPTSELEDNRKTGSKESAIGDTRADDGKAGGEDVKTGELKTEVTPGDGVSAIQTGSEKPATGGESNRAGEEIKSNSREQIKGKVEKPLTETSEVTEPTPIKEVKEQAKNAEKGQPLNSTWEERQALREKAKKNLVIDDLFNALPEKIRNSLQNRTSDFFYKGESWKNVIEKSAVNPDMWVNTKDTQQIPESGYVFDANTVTDYYLVGADNQRNYSRKIPKEYYDYFNQIKERYNQLIDNNGENPTVKESLPVETPVSEDKKGEIPTSPDGLYQIYTVKVKNKEGGIDNYFGVPSPLNKGERGFGDDLVNTLEQAIKTSEYNRFQEGEIARRKAEQEEADRKREAETNAKKKANKGKTKLEIMNEAKDAKILDVKLNYDGVIQTRREHVVAVINDGGHTETAEVNKVKDVSRTAYNRMDGRQQENLERRIKEGGKKTEYRLYTKDGTFYDITKAEYDYAQTLENQLPEAGKKVKEPWEMTREEFDKSEMYSEEVTGNFTEEQAQALNNDLSSPWIYTKYGGRPKRFKSHKKSVQQALSEGKIIPENVKKDYPELFDGKKVINPERLNDHPSVSEPRKTVLPEYNNSTEIINLNAFVDKVRKLDPNNKSDKLIINMGYAYEAQVSYPNSLGEQGTYNEFWYKEKPTVADFEKDLLEFYPEEIKNLQGNELPYGGYAIGAKDENIIKELQKALDYNSKKPESQTVKESLPVETPVSEDKKVVAPTKPQGVKDTPKPQEKQRPAGEVLSELTDKKIPKGYGKGNKISTESAAKVDTPELSKKAQKMLNELQQGKLFNEVSEENELTEKEQIQLAKLFAESDKFPSKQYAKKDKIDIGFESQSNYDVKPIEKKITPIKDNSTASKISSLKSIVAGDDRLPILTGVFKDAENNKLVATDTHVLIVIEDKTIKKSEVINPKTGEFIADGANYPNYDAVIPRDNPLKRTVNVNEWLAQLNGLVNTKRFFSNPLGVRIIIGDNTYYFNSEIMQSVFQVFAEHGVENVELQFSDPTRALVVESNKGIMGLVMPFMEDDDSKASGLFGYKTMAEWEYMSKTTKGVEVPTEKKVGEKAVKTFVGVDDSRAYINEANKVFDDVRNKRLEAISEKLQNGKLTNKEYVAAVKEMDKQFASEYPQYFKYDTSLKNSESLDNAKKTLLEKGSAELLSGKENEFRKTLGLEPTEGGVSTLEEKKITQVTGIKPKNKNKVETPVSEDKKEQPVEKIEDFGEKIEGAKKDIYQRMKDVTHNDIISLPLSKTFPRPDFVQLVKDGTLSEDGATILKFVYEQIPSKPRKKYKLASWARVVQDAIDTYSDFLQTEGMDQKWITRLKESDKYKYLWSKYEHFREVQKALGFPKEDINTGAYEIKSFVNSEGRKVSIVKSPYIISDHENIQEAADALKAMLVQNKTKSKGVKLDLYQDTKTKKYFIGRKTATGTFRLVDGIETLKEGGDKLKNEQAQLQELWDNLKIKPNERRDKNRDRVGTDYRKGKDVTPEEFGDTFGFRGVQFGNWVKGNERQESLNDAYDALMDLSTALKISPRALSLGGELGMAFGARGSGKFSAHYESGQVVINLTKTKGAGSLAHEWWHAIDSYFSRTRGNKGGFLTESPRQKMNVVGNHVVPDESLRDELIAAFKGVVDVIRKSEIPTRSKKLDSTRSDLYWSTIIEMSARSFENFIIEKLGATNEQNDYLANFKEMGEWIKSGNLSPENYPYPTKDETGKINEAFQQLFDTIQEKTDEEGNSVLFAKAYNEAERVPQKVIDRIFEGEQVSRKPKETTFEYAKRLFRQAKKNAPNAPEVVVVKKIEDLKGVLSDKALATVKNFDTAHGTPAFYVNGKMYVIAENIKGFNSNFAAKLWLHEVGVHHGLNILFNETQKQETLQKIADFAGRDNMLAFIEKETNNKGLTGYENLGDTELAEEYLAYLSKKMDDPSKVTAKERSVWAKIVEWIRSKVKNFLGHNISNKDVMDIVKSAVQANYTDSSITGITSDGVRFQIAGESGAANLDKAERKQKQLGIVLKMNPISDNIHTGIRTINDIKTAEEVFSESINDNEDATPDFTVDDMKAALESGRITVYSSKPIKNGVFISPSYMQAESYSGNKKVYSKEVSVNDVAWIDQFEGQLTEIDKAEEATTRLDNLGVAKKMESKFLVEQEKRETDAGLKHTWEISNEDALKIRMATGWEKGSDGEWRYEIPDFQPKKYVDKAKFQEAVKAKAEIDRLNKEKDYDTNRGHWIKTLENYYKLIGYSMFDRDNARQIEKALKENNSNLLPAQPVRHSIRFWSDTKIDGKALLTDIIEDDNLFKAYPELKGISIYFGNIDSAGAYTPKTDEIVLNKSFSDEGTIFSNQSSEEQVKSILLHEIQHAIQEIEGFARGGNTEMFKGISELKKLFTKQREDFSKEFGFSAWEDNLMFNDTKRFSALIDAGFSDISLKPLYEAFANEKLPESDRNYFVNRMLKFDDDVSSHKDIDPFTGYQRLAGEVEARNVQNRINMSEEDRRGTPLKETEDTPRKDQIIYEGDDVKFMANQTGDPNFDSRHEPIIKGAYENALEIFHDNMRSVKTLQELITKRGGVMGEDLDTHLFENLTSSISKAEIENFENSIQRRFLGAVKHIAGRYGIDADGIGIYLMAKHASERNKVMQMQGFKLEEGSGMSNVEAEAYISEFEGKVDQADIKELLDSRSEVTGFTLRTLNEKGLITNDQYRKYKNQYTDYVPLRGWAGETASDIYKYIEDNINRDAPPMKHAKGRTSLADNPLPYMLSMAHAAIIMGNKNVMRTKALNMVRANSQMQDLFSENPIYEVKQDDGTTITTVNRPDQELFDQKKVTVIKDTRNLYKNTIHNASQHDVIVYDNGEKKVISFTDPVVARSINGENMVAKDFVSKILSPTVGRVQRFISANFTSKNPAFVPVNWTRDFGYAYFSHFVKGDKGDAKYFRKSMMNSFKAVSRHLKHNLGTTFSEQAINDAQIKISNGESLTNADYDALYYSFKMNGGETGYVHLKNIKNFKKDIEKELRLAVGNPTRWEAANNYAPIKKAGEWMEYMAQMSENQARFSTYLVSMSKGKSHAQSASDAKNITVNFNRRGKVSGLMGNLYVFFNANVQGVANIGKLAKDHPKAFAKLGAGFMTMGFLSSLLTRMWADDDDDENAFDKIPTYIKYNFWVLPNPAYYLGYGEKKEKFLTIPLPHGFRAVYALGVMAYEASTGTKGAGDIAIDLVTNTADSFSPITSLNPDEMLKGDITLRPIVPSWMMPFYDINVNRDFAGRMVYKEPFTKALEKKIPGSEQSLPNVNPLLKNAARGLNRLGGGDLNRTAAIGFNPKTTKVDAERNEWKWLIYDWNPSKAEHLLEYYLGGKGKFFNNIYKTTRDATLSVINKENQMNEYTTPILRRFIYTPYTKDTPDKYWELKNEISTWKGLYNDAKSNKDIEMMGRFQKNRRMMELINEFDRSEKRIKDMNERIDRSINPEMKKKLIKDRRMIIKDFLNKSKEIDKRHENSNR